MPSPLPNGAANIRTLALVGPAAAGKTSLAEALLCRAGAIGAPGSLERGTTVSDFDVLERRAQHSLNAALLHMHHEDTRIHLIDTPGTSDFLGQSLPALEAVETAMVVIGAPNGVEIMAERMMAYAAQRERCRLIVVNKIDALGIDLQALVSQIQSAFGKECLPLNLPADRGARVVDCFFNPSEGNPPKFLKGEGAAALPLTALPDPALHVLAHVFKVTQDPYVGKMGVFRIHQGTLTRDSQLYIGDGRRPFKVGHLFMLQGKEHVEVTHAYPGDICAVAKVDELHFDAVLHDAAEDDHLHLLPLDFPVPVHGLAIEPKRRGDEQRLWDIVQKLVDEDPCLKVEHVVVTNETVIYGLGELHLRMLLERLTDVYKCEVNTRPPRIAYRETITVAAEGHHRHKKQTGGAGQFGEVFLRIEPLPRGAGFEFLDQVKGGTIPGQYIPAVEKGVRLALESGVIAGFPVKDVRVVVYDGKHHAVDSKDIAFTTAGRKAFIDAVTKAGPIVLEPIANVEITAPEAAIGDITGDLSAKRGLVSGTRTAQAGSLTVLGQAPQSELNGYQSRLNAMTAGQGRYSVALSHYQAVPPSVQQQLVGQYQAKDED